MFYVTFTSEIESTNIKVNSWQNLPFYVIKRFPIIWAKYSTATVGYFPSSKVFKQNYSSQSLIANAISFITFA